MYMFFMSSLELHTTVCVVCNSKVGFRSTNKLQEQECFIFHCLSASGAAVAGGLVIRRSPAQIPAPLGGTGIHVEVSLSKILNPKIAPDVQMAPCVAATAISKGPAMSCQLIQGVPWPMPIVWTGFGPSKPQGPLGGNCDPHGEQECAILNHLSLRNTSQRDYCFSALKTSIWCIPYNNKIINTSLDTNLYNDLQQHLLQLKHCV